MARHLARASVQAVDKRLTGGGWLTVASLQLIPVIPFLPTNYACGLSSVRARPYLVGILPGTTAAVVLGDTLAGTTPPALLAVYALCAVAGTTGLWFVIRRHTLDLRPAD